MDDNLGISRLQPDQAVDNYDESEYKKNLLFLAGQYNNALNNVPILTGNGTITSTGTTSYISEYFNNLTYIYGTQGNANYGFFTKDYSGNDTQVPMLRGLDVYKIFNYLHGQATELIDPLPKTAVASAYSVNAQSAKKEMMDYISFQIKHKAFLQYIQLETGFGFKPIDRDFQTQAQVDMFFENFQETMEIAYDRLAKDVIYTNDYQLKLPKAFDYALIGNLAGLVIEYENGRPRWRIVTPDKAIVDNLGLDGSGENCSISESLRNESLNLNSNPKFLPVIYQDKRFINAFYNNYTSTKRPLWQKLINRIVS